MHIAYSAFKEIIAQNSTIVSPVQAVNSEDLMLRLLAHQQVCAKYSKEIAAIQKYLPNWEPVFSMNEG